jgi:hypothetical protein
MESEFGSQRNPQRDSAFNGRALDQLALWSAIWSSINRSGNELSGQHYSQHQSDAEVTALTSEPKDINITVKALQRRLRTERHGRAATPA